MANKARILEILAAVTYAAEFVPQSKSRNASEPRPCLNWRVTLAGKGRTITTDYMQGIGHVPDHQHMRRTIDVANYETECAETGKYAPGGLYIKNANGSNGARSIGRAKLPPPDLLDVVYCLVSDADVIDCASFEDWAGDYGYDTDSRAAEKTYRECLAIALELRALLGDAALAELRELFSDY